MKTKLTIFFLAVILNVACKKDFLDKGPSEDITMDEVFKQKRYAEGILINVYGNLPNGIYFSDLLDPNPFVIASDELDVPWPDKFGKLMNRGAWNADNTPFQAWKNMYGGIRYANIFLENIDKVPMDAAEKERWRGEATFLRAYLHFVMLRIYGPIPIMDHSTTSGEDYSLIMRQPLDDCVNFIVSECDKAVPLLPLTVTSDKYGRATRAAALALKSTVLLYAASPLWNGNPDYVNFADKNGVKLFPSAYDENKWQRAADAAKDCIDQSEQGGYKLYYSGSGDPVANYQELFLVNWNEEVLFAYNAGNDGWMEKCSFPRGMGGWSGWSPTQEQVDEYEMENGEQPILGYNPDGSPIINPDSEYQETGYASQAGPNNRWLAGVRNMYVKREPRFYATINFSGAFWKDRPIEFWLSGKDGKVGGGYTTTGYLLKKFSSPNVDIPAGRWVNKTWIYFRLGEQYLNYAEALNEAKGPVGDVYKYVNLIRSRAGLPGLPADLSKSEMREKIRHERRVELAYESHRFFDCHRWKIAATTDNREIHGMNVSAGNSLQDDNFYKRTVVEKRVFTPKHYLFPIPQSEINKNPNLVQNPGW